PVQQNAPGGTSTIPINVGDLTNNSGDPNNDVFSYDFDISFDPNVLQPQATPYEATGTLSNGMVINTSTATAGHLQLNAFGTAALRGAGTLLLLKFNV